VRFEAARLRSASTPKYGAQRHQLDPSANSAAQALSRFTTCVLQSGIEIPYGAIKANIAESLNIMVQMDRRPGARFLSQILEICAYNREADHYDFNPVYVLPEKPLETVSNGEQLLSPHLTRNRDHSPESAV
jgi:hypothetical protein